MSDTVISVENLSKRYFIGAKEELPQTKGEAIHHLISAPFKYLQSKVREPNPEDTFWALKDVSFEVKAGEVVGLIGRNGAGKSTLLKILSRITKPSSGCVKIRGRVGSLLEVGTGFHPELSGRENIYLNGTILGMSKKEINQKFDEIVDFAEIEKFLDTPVKRYSSGMYVRLAFAVAAHLETEILVVDEVLAVGDVEFQKKCLGKMGKVATKEGRTVLFVSHNMTAVKSLCNLGILLNNGKILTQGSVNKITDDYINLTSNNQQKSAQKSENFFLRVYLQTDEGKIVKHINLNQEIYLIFIVSINDSRDLNIGFTLFKNDIPILSSCVTDSIETISIGLSELKIEMPVELLTSGEYRVEGAIWNCYKVYDQNDYLAVFSMSRNSLLESRNLDYRGILAFSGSWSVNSR